MKKIMTVCCAGGLIVILSLCTVSTVESAVAFITAYPAGKQLDNWRENQRQLEHAQWEKIQSQIDLALQFTPDNPELLNDLGLSHEAEFIFSEDTDPSATRDRKTAARYYQQAVVLRPSWPYDRIDLALVDYRLYGTNRNLYKLMRQAVELGPWEPRVQQVVTEIGLRNWKGLPDNMKKDALLKIDGGRFGLARIGHADLEVLDVLEQLEGDLTLGLDGHCGNDLFVRIGDDLVFREQGDVDVLDLLHEVQGKKILRVDLEVGQFLELLRRVAQRDADELLAAAVLELDGAGHRDPGLAAHEADQGLLIVDLGLEIGRLALGEVGLGGQPLLLELEIAVEIGFPELERELGAL